MTTEMLARPDCGLRGLALLDAVIAKIEASPKTWCQLYYRCGSGMCVAGHVDDLAGGRWAVPDPDSALASLLLAEPSDDPVLVWTNPRFGAVTSARNRATRLLRISDDDGFDLFWSLNSLARIKQVRDRIAAGEQS